MPFTRFLQVVADIRGRLKGLTEHLPYYVVEGANWSIDLDGLYVAREIKSRYGLECKVITNHKELRYLHRQVIHFGSLHLLMGRGSCVHASNRVVVTIFHGQEEDPAFRQSIGVLRQKWSLLSRVVVPSRAMEERVKRWGVSEHLVVRIPVGVDLDLFAPPSEGKRRLIRQKLGIPEDRIVIGSFQKDGVGWTEGLEPKWIKGPDIFLGVIERLIQELPLFVLLTGPARGYVLQGLKSLGVEHRHLLIDRYAAMASCYHALDIYVITSREEGGPKGLLESMATAVPVVSTKVGMAQELIVDGENGFLCEVEDVKRLADRILELAKDPGIGRRFAENGLATVRKCDVKEVGRLHYEKVYSPLLESLA